jgi:hypothetical protein
MMFIGSSLWAYIIGAGSSIVASLSPAADNHRRTIGMLNHFCNDHHVTSRHSPCPSCVTTLAIGRGTAESCRF